METGAGRGAAVGGARHRKGRGLGGRGRRAGGGGFRLPPHGAPPAPRGLLLLLGRGAGRGAVPHGAVGPAVARGAAGPAAGGGAGLRRPPAALGRHLPLRLLLLLLPPPGRPPAPRPLCLPDGLCLPRPRALLLPHRQRLPAGGQPPGRAALRAAVPHLAGAGAAGVAAQPGPGDVHGQHQLLRPRRPPPGLRRPRRHAALPLPAAPHPPHRGLRRALPRRLRRADADAGGRALLPVPGGSLRADGRGGAADPEQTGAVLRRPPARPRRVQRHQVPAAPFPADLGAAGGRRELHLPHPPPPRRDPALGEGRPLGGAPPLPPPPDPSPPGSDGPETLGASEEADPPLLAAAPPPPAEEGAGGGGGVPPAAAPSPTPYPRPRHLCASS